MKQAEGFRKKQVLHICILILKSGMGINDQWNYPKDISFTGRITAAAFIPEMSGILQ